MTTPGDSFSYANSIPLLSVLAEQLCWLGWEDKLYSWRPGSHCIDLVSNMVAFMNLQASIREAAGDSRRGCAVPLVPVSCDMEESGVKLQGPEGGKELTKGTS